MSGGSWGYFYLELEDVADALTESEDPLRRALGEHFKVCAKAMHAIEWSDSGDTGPDNWKPAVREALKDA